MGNSGNLAPIPQGNFVGEIGDIRRFPNAKKLCSYFGLVPEVRQSAEKKYYDSITKGGSKYGRWGLAEAIQRLGKHDIANSKQNGIISSQKPEVMTPGFAIQYSILFWVRCMSNYIESAIANWGNNTIKFSRKEERR